MHLSTTKEDPLSFSVALVQIITQHHARVVFGVIVQGIVGYLDKEVVHNRCR